MQQTREMIRLGRQDRKRGKKMKAALFFFVSFDILFDRYEFGTIKILNEPFGCTAGPLFHQGGDVRLDH